eukprot:7391450-Prymnesium_polylepis.3
MSMAAAAQQRVGRLIALLRPSHGGPRLTRGPRGSDEGETATGGMEIRARAKTHPDYRVDSEVSTGTVYKASRKPIQLRHGS